MPFFKCDRRKPAPVVFVFELSDKVILLSVLFDDCFQMFVCLLAWCLTALSAHIGYIVS